MYRSKTPEVPDEPEETKPLKKLSLSLWKDVPLSQKVRHQQVFSPYFPVKGTQKIAAFDNVLSAAECLYLVQAMDSAQTGAVTKKQTMLVPKDSSRWVSSIEKRLAVLLRTHPGKVETLVLEKRGRAPKHDDDDDSAPVLDFIEDCDHPAGQRVSSLMVFLNDLPELEEGGRSIFSKLNGGLRPRRGTAIAWNNIDHQTKKVDNQMVHMEEPLYLRKSKKYILLAWSRERAFEEDE